MKTRKMFLSMLAIAGMLFASSCNKEDMQTQTPDGDFVNATFTLGTENGIGTRAGELTIGKGTKVDVVECAVYDVNGKEMTALRETVAVREENGKRVAQFNTRLAKGQSYRVAFFAYNRNAAAYDLTDMTNIIIKEEGLNSNVEERDAFTNYAIISANETMNSIAKEVVLNRPFAQLNLGIDDVEYENASNAGVIIKKSSIKVNGIYNAFNAYEDKVSATATAKTIEFALNDIPNEDLLVDADDDGQFEANEVYKYLALNYLLVGDATSEKSIVEVEFGWKTEDGKENNPKTTFMTIPVQRNYRTNIIGNLLTNPAEFNVVINPEFIISPADDHNQIFTDINGVKTATVTPDGIQEVLNKIGAGITNNDPVPGDYYFNLSEYTKSANTKASGDNTITVVQNEGVNITIDGNGINFGKQIVVNGNARAAGKEYLKLVNINFTTDSAEDFTFVSAPSKINNRYNYSHNVTIDNCTFTNKGSNTEIGSISFTGTYNLVVRNCTATNMHSLLQAQSVDNTVLVDNVKTINCKNGVSFGNTAFPTLKNSDIQASEYGVRGDGNASRGNLVIMNTKISAAKPVIIRKVTTDGYAVAFENNVVLNTENQYHVVFTTDNDDKDYVAPSNEFSVAGADNFNVFPADNKPMIASNANQLNALLNNSAVSNIVLAADINAEVVMKSNKTIDGNGYLLGSINLNGASNVTLKNIKFDAANAVYGYDGAGTKKDYAYSNIITGDNINKPNKGAHNLVIDGCTFTGTFANPGAPIAFTDQKRGEGGSGNVTIKNCKFENQNANYTIYSHYTGDSTNGHGNFIIESNVFSSKCYAGPIYLGRYASNVPVVVKDNKFETVTSIDYAIYVQDHSSYGVSVDASNNTFKN